MDIRARPNDPAVVELARSIHAMFPSCVACGAVIERFEDADVRVLSHRVVHRACAAAARAAEPPASVSEG